MLQFKEEASIKGKAIEVAQHLVRFIIDIVLVTDELVRNL
jgi:hypothetical protein